MTIVGKASRAMRIACICVLAAACAGPLPSSSADASFEPTELAFASPTAEPTLTTEPTFTFAPSPSLPFETPIVDPTYEPDPTPEGARPPRTAIEINEHVVDRPGAPDDLRAKYWVRGSDVGSLGTTAQLGLLGDESIIEARDGRVISRHESPTTDGDEIVVRDFSTGAIVFAISTTARYVDATALGTVLFWTGLEPDPSSSEQQIDGGVWAVSIEGGDAVQIVAPGKVVSYFSGRRLLVSPSGRTLGAVMSSYGNTNWIDVIDVDSLTRLRRLRGFWPDAITDDTFIQFDQPPSDGLAYGLGGITAFDLATGVSLWKYPDAGEVKRFARWRTISLGTKFFVEYFWDTSSGARLVLATFDPRSGERRALLRQDDTPEQNDLWYMWPGQSTATHISLATDAFPFGASAQTFAVLDVPSATVDWAAYTIDPPFICSYDWCFRD